MAKFEPILRQGRAEPLEIGGTLVEVDTTDFAHVDYDMLLASLCPLL
jgi:hypothetical protein